MSWNYRVMRHFDNAGNETYGIHEVYYTPEGKPNMYSVEAVAPYGETLAELQEEVRRFAEALEKPVLKPGDFPVDLTPENDVDGPHTA